jgi:hypothetical protein
VYGETMWEQMWWVVQKNTFFPYWRHLTDWCFDAKQCPKCSDCLSACLCHVASYSFFTIPTPW